MLKRFVIVATLGALPLFAQEAPQSPPSDAETKKIVELLSKLKVSGYIHAQYVHDESSVNEVGENRDQFTVRRARVRFTYEFSPTSRFILQPDISSSGVTLKQGVIELVEPWTPWKHTLTAGQFKWPFGFELIQSSTVREVPERARVTRTLFPGDYDRGVMLSATRERFHYRVAIVNGTGTVRSDDLNKRKDFLGRAGWSFGKLDVAASLYRGSDLIATSTNPRGVEFDKQRQGVEFQWTTPLPGFAVRGEYITGKQAPPAGTTRSESFDVRGWYFYAMQKVGKRHQFVVRVDEYDPDSGASGNAIRTVNPTYIFQWDNHSKVMASYEFIDTDADDDVFTLRWQYSF